jgi:hypothetical protein
VPCAITKSIVQDGTPGDATDVRKSIRELLLDSRACPAVKAPELNPSRAHQVLVQASALLADWGLGPQAPGRHRAQDGQKAASYKKEVIPYLTKGLMIYIRKLHAPPYSRTSKSHTLPVGII